MSRRDGHFMNGEACGSKRQRRQIDGGRVAGAAYNAVELRVERAEAARSAHVLACRLVQVNQNARAVIGHKQNAVVTPLRRGRAARKQAEKNKQEEHHKLE